MNIDFKDKKILTITILAAISFCLLVGVIITAISLSSTKEENAVISSENAAIAKEKQEIEELVAFEKAEMQNDLATAQFEYQELIVKINNDSLRFKLEREQMRTKALIEELERTKATNYAEITRLKKELKTLREVLKDYTRQIAELSKENESLKQENSAVKEKYKNATKKIDNLAVEKEKLSEKVSLASQLDATDISVTMLRSNGKSTERIKRAKEIKVSFRIAKNITSSTGEKVAYVRILDPSMDVLKKNDSNLFEYENKSISYSMKKDFEFTGEETRIDMYWKIEETLQQGEYKVYIFVDGNMIGSSSVNFEK